MRKAIDGWQAKEKDRYSIENGMPSLVLMERAAQAVVNEVCSIERCRDRRIAAVCSVGNNGADGLAVLRILAEKGYSCTAIVLGDSDRSTEEFNHQLRIAKLWNIPVIYYGSYNGKICFAEYNIIVDALFGIGLSRPIEGDYAELIQQINASGKTVVAVDIPSGVDSTTGAVLGVAVRAEVTVTFGNAKLGQLLYPGKEYCGRLIVSEVGFLPMDEVEGHYAYYFEHGGDVINAIPVRERRTNKGNYGKPLIIAGSEDMTGAAYMSGLAAYRTGAGVVTVLTHSSVDKYLKSILPEAIVRSYDEPELGTAELIKAASIVVLGPGIAVSEMSERLVKHVLKNVSAPLILDADALNIISKDVKAYIGESGIRSTKEPVVVTPHVGEMARLTGCSASEISRDIMHYTLDFAESYNVYCVLKDAVTVIASPAGKLFLSSAGNPGMATAGSGDVLTGIMAAITALKPEGQGSGDEFFDKLSLAVQFHGMTGDAAAAKLGEYSVMARDIIDTIPEMLL